MAARPRRPRLTTASALVEAYGKVQSLQWRLEHTPTIVDALLADYAHLKTTQLMTPENAQPRSGHDYLGSGGACRRAPHHIGSGGKARYLQASAFRAYVTKQRAAQQPEA